MVNTYVQRELSQIQVHREHKASLQISDPYGGKTKWLSIDNQKLHELKKLLADDKHQAVSKGLIDSVLLVLLQRPQNITDEAFNTALDHLERDFRKENL